MGKIGRRAARALAAAAVVAICAPAGDGRTADGIEFCAEGGACTAAIAWTVAGDFKQDDQLSGAACATATACLIANDEKGYAQYFSLDVAGRRLVPGEKVGLLADTDSELDAEAVAFADHAYYLIGSHGRGRNSGTLKDESFLVVRAATDSEGRIVTVEVTDAMRLMIRAAPALQPYAEISLQANGANIEGLAVTGDTLLAGFRGPSVDEQGYVMAVAAGALFSAGEQTARVMALPLGKDIGIRDMAPVGGGYLLLTGPVLEALAEPALVFWDGSTAVRSVGRLRGLPLDAAGGSAKAEGLLYLGEAPEGLRFLVIFDGPSQGAPHEILVPGLSPPP